MHGDYRLGNTIFARRAPARLEAVLDWEMATIGDPLADLGYLCMMWTERGDPNGGMREDLGGVTRARGLSHARGADRALRAAHGALDGATCAGTRRSRCGSRWCSWRATTSARMAGATDDPYLKQFGDGVVELADQAEGVAHGD